MSSVQPGDQVVELAPDGERVEVYTVAKVLADGVQVSGASGKLANASLRQYDENVVEQIKDKENQLASLKREIKALYESLKGVN
jgi:hypothetical protein